MAAGHHPLDPVMRQIYSDDDAEQTVVERIDPLIGTTFDQRYRILERIATGGFGAIYRAIHLPSSRHVALKVLHDSSMAPSRSLVFGMK